jgi:hypothetical protein
MLPRPRQIADQDPLAIAYGLGHYVLVSGGFLQDGGDMDAAFVGKSTMPNKGLIVGQRQIGQLRDEARHIRQTDELVLTDGCVTLALAPDWR